MNNKEKYYLVKLSQADPRYTSAETARLSDVRGSNPKITGKVQSTPNPNSSELARLIQARGGLKAGPSLPVSGGQGAGGGRGTPRGGGMARMGFLSGSPGGGGVAGGSRGMDRKLP
jgi:hypothetical protein